jgi:iron complex outermembrane receptor protein
MSIKSLQACASAASILCCLALFSPTMLGELDLMGRYVDNLPSKLPGISIPSYFTMDARLGWRPKPPLELALVGQNLLDNHHPEFTDSVSGQVIGEVQRGAYGMATWSY